MATGCVVNGPAWLQMEPLCSYRAIQQRRQQDTSQLLEVTSTISTFARSKYTQKVRRCVNFCLSTVTCPGPNVIAAARWCCEMNLLPPIGSETSVFYKASSDHILVWFPSLASITVLNGTDVNSRYRPGLVSFYCSMHVQFLSLSY
jgi:hypothetical protein